MCVAHCSVAATKNNTMIRLDELTQQAGQLAKQVGKFIRDQKNKITADKIETKGLHDHVTYVDKTAECKLVEALTTILPEAGFIAEEGTTDRIGEKYNWIVDPLDGTSNFIHGFGPFAVSIALAETNGKLILGVVYEIMNDELFYAHKQSGAFCNGKPIACSLTNNLTDAMLATGFPYNEFEKLDKHIATLSFFLRKSRGIRRMGSAATDMCYVACGRFDAFWEYDLSPWDVAAGAIILQQAGGVAQDFSGGNNFLFGKELMCASESIAAPFFEVVSDHFSNSTTK